MTDSHAAPTKALPHKDDELCFADALIQLSHDIKPQGIGILAISSNSILTHPQDGPERMAKDANSFGKVTFVHFVLCMGQSIFVQRHGALLAGYPFKYLYDESQEVAKAFKAACTPEFYLADSGLQLFYHGQFDGSRPSNDTAVTGKFTHNHFINDMRMQTCPVTCLQLVRAFADSLSWY